MRITKVPESLGELRQLRLLFVNENQLTGLQESLRLLTELRVLYAYKNQLTALPEWLSDLPYLEEIMVFSNHLTSLPESLFQLKRLWRLDLRFNHITTLQDSVGQLSQLKELDLSDNQLTALPESMGKLSQLERLNLADNQLTALPESLTQLKRLRQLYLHGNPGLGLSPDILGPTWESVKRHKERADPRAILAFYFSQRKATAKPLNEVKLLLVGHGRVGKTSLSKALRDIPHDETEPETPGIEPHPLPLAAGKSTITAHVWDFGGQEFLHQTHQFFFSERSIYVVVLSGRQGQPMQEAESAAADPHLRNRFDCRNRAQPDQSTSFHGG